MGVVAIVQARLGSSRLPGKVMKVVAGKPLLGHLLAQLEGCQRLDRVVVATPDQEIADYCACAFVGDEHDVLRRYVEAARAFEATTIVRLTADNPLIDPELVDEVVAQFEASDFDYLSNTRERGFPRGMDVEVFTREALERADREALEADEREHVTLYLYRHPERFRIGSFQYRLTVDTPEDLAYVSQVIERVGKPAKLHEIYEVMHGLCDRRGRVELEPGPGASEADD